ncbi:MAG: hypothetical protein P0Y53_17810 [Candidatus Pseudobacter hemicellulosilyticus]|uniref:DUF5018 domain-containing protein n=1 Tax=Candidatus Pseudobacter hemicellulosilyticus TaxID=3121375 RepID=A0AAJ5WPE6_9BACT|nr:MAG: hypothetical protein P0Y53_17810 [Pseudobacter sp.]
MNQLNIKRNYFFLVLAGLLAAGSCTREVDNWINKEADTIYDTLSSLPGNRILAFQVTNLVETEERIYSSIDDSAKTITVYLPAYYGLGVIQPEISLPAGSAVSPDPDLPIPVFYETPAQYTVTAANGASTTYKVEIIVQQAALLVDELSSATKTYVFRMRTRPGGSVTITGDNIIPLYSITSAYLIDDQGREVMKLAELQSGSANTSETIRYIMPYAGDNIPVGLYYLELRSYALTRRMQYPIQLTL